MPGLSAEIFLFSCDFPHCIHLPPPPPPKEKTKKQHENMQHKKQGVMIQASGVTFKCPQVAGVTHQSPYDCWWVKCVSFCTRAGGSLQ